MVQRQKFLEVGGFDTGLSDIWAPDDMDFIARYEAYYKESYRKLAPNYTFNMDIKGTQLKIERQREAKNVKWIEHIGVRDPGFNLVNFKNTKFYARIGATQLEKVKLIEDTINYFLIHDPKIEFIACKPNGQLFVVSSVELEGPGNMLSS